MADFDFANPAFDRDDVEMVDVDEPEDIIDDEETSFIILASESTLIHKQEHVLGDLTGSNLKAQRRELLKTKVNAFLKVAPDRDGLLPGPDMYNEFVLGADGRTLKLKNGVQVTF